jgi:hypothetical protein
MQALCLGFSPALEKRAGGLSDISGSRNRFGPQPSVAFPPEPGTRLTQLLVQGKDSNAALPLHPHPAPCCHMGKIQVISQTQNFCATMHVTALEQSFATQTPSPCLQAKKSRITILDTARG